MEETSPTLLAPGRTGKGYKNQKFASFYLSSRSSDLGSASHPQGSGSWAEVSVSVSGGSRNSHKVPFTGSQWT